MKSVVYTGLESEGLCHGGEYYVIRDVVVCNRMMGRVLLDDCGKEHFVSIWDCR